MFTMPTPIQSLTSFVKMRTFIAFIPKRNQLTLEQLRIDFFITISFTAVHF